MNTRTPSLRHSVTPSLRHSVTKFSQAESDEKLLAAYLAGDRESCEQLSDGDLLDRYARLKCQDSFRILYDRYCDKVVAFIGKLVCNYTRDTDVRDDISQNVWITVAVKPHQFKNDREFLHWLLRIAWHRSIDYLRALRKRHKREGAKLPSRFSSDEPIDERYRRESATRSDELMECVSRLSRPRREAIEAVYVKGLSYADAALACGIKERALFTRISAAKEFLKLSVA